MLSYHRKYGRTDPRWTKYWVYILFALNIVTFALAFSKAIKIRALHLCDFTVSTLSPARAILERDTQGAPQAD